MMGIYGSSSGGCRISSLCSQFNAYNTLVAIRQTDAPNSVKLDYILLGPYTSIKERNWGWVFERKICRQDHPHLAETGDLELAVHDIKRIAVHLTHLGRAVCTTPGGGRRRSAHR
jgi:hypothetical protein